MRILLSLILLALALTAPAQTWVEVPIDENITVMLPPDNTYMDTLGGGNWVGQDTNSGFIAFKRGLDAEAKKSIIRNDDHLRGMYESIIKEVEKPGNPANVELMDHEVIEWKGLLVLSYRLKVFSGEMVMIQEAWQLFLKEAFYLFACNTEISMTENPRARVERDKFFNGIRLTAGITRDEQYMTDEIYRRIGKAIGSYLPHILVGIVIAIALYYGQRKKKRAAANPPADSFPTPPDQNNV